MLASGEFDLTCVQAVKHRLKARVYDAQIADNPIGVHYFHFNQVALD
jgi:hypothetical protein